MQPTFVLSLDKELIWGSFDHTSDRTFVSRYPDLRGVVDRLLRLLDEHRIPATWAVVGHLFLDRCARGPDGRAHPELPRPRYSWYTKDWFDRDPCTDARRDPMWYGPDIVDAILASDTRHEVACHSFSHIVYGDPGTSIEVAEADVVACTDAARARGITLRSFVFPRNVEGHHAILAKHGFTAFRGADPTWYSGAPGALKRVAHFADQALALAPPVVRPLAHPSGMTNIPGSMLLLHRAGARKLIPAEARARKGERGLDAAVRDGGLFHLWFHPFNLAVDADVMFGALARILRHAAALRDRGVLRIETMADVASARMAT